MLHLKIKGAHEIFQNLIYSHHPYESTKLGGGTSESSRHPGRKPKINRREIMLAGLAPINLCELGENYSLRTVASPKLSLKYLDNRKTYPEHVRILRIQYPGALPVKTT